MAINNRIKTTELDFDEIKSNLKEFMRGQSQFSDYDFDGSGLSILLDVLAYNTHYNALYNNLAVNEAFLDSASKRSSVVSKAKELGYVPRSSRAATARVALAMINDQVNAPESIEVPRYTPFNTKVGDRNFTFYTIGTQIAYRQGNQYLFESIELKEGTQLQYKYVMDNNVQMVVPNDNVDVSTFRVVVQENSQSSNYEIYENATGVVNDINPQSKVYFVKELDNGRYELQFGDGITGKALVPGNVITIDYIVCNQEAPNGARQFTFNGAVPSNTASFVVTLDASFGGAAPESIDSIKWNAPRAYSSQNRCVTVDDFRTVIRNLYPGAQSVNVWGGEQNTPPSYGDVFISVKPFDREALSGAEKSYVLNEILGPRKLVTIHPKFVDPTYIDVELNTTVYYNPAETNRTAADIEVLVRQTIQNYVDTELDQFGGVLKYSVISRDIDETEASIVSSITTVKIHREVIPYYNQSAEYVVDLGNPIYNSGVAENSIISSGITVLNTAQTVYIDDIPTSGSPIGSLRMFYYLGGTKVEVKRIGTVDYDKGIIRINNLIVTGVGDDGFKFVIKPQSNDIASIRNQIVTIPPELVKVTPVVNSAADNYKFTSSRT